MLRHWDGFNDASVTYLKDKFSESIWVFVIEEESIAGVSRRGFKEKQEELVFGWAALQKAQQQLQQSTQLQNKRPQFTHHIFQ